jgi:hypothetical protein
LKELLMFRSIRLPLVTILLSLLFVQLLSCSDSSTDPAGDENGGTGGVETNVTSAISSWFSDAAGGDLHLVVADTSVVDKRQSLSAVTRDVDCESRPKGSGYDIGADEK